MCNGRGEIPLLGNFGTPPLLKDPPVNRCIKLVIVA